VPLGGAGAHREFELADPAPLPPPAQFAGEVRHLSCLAPTAIPSGELSGDSRRGTVIAMTELEIVDRYVAVWNETDPSRRAGIVRTLWTDDAVHLLQPPKEIADGAASVGFFDLVLEARGHAALDRRVTRAHQEFVGDGHFTFRSRGDAERLRNVVKFRWEMVDRDTGEVAGVGLQFLVLGPDGRITDDYQFIES
jgi:hypothetical protein